MALFEYRAIDKSGKKRKGKVDAPSLKQATTKIKSQGLHLVSISSAKEKLKGVFDSRIPQKGARVPFDIVTNFTRQLSILVSTGIPYDKAFDILIEESEHATFQHVLDLIKARIVEGSSLASALENHPTLFSKMYVAMVKAGEAGGTLDQVLQYLTTAREGTAEIKSKIQKALIYPIIMTLMGFGIVIFMVTFIILSVLSAVSSFVLTVVPVFEMVFELMFPIVFLGSAAFMVSTIIRNGSGTAVVMVIFGITFWILRDFFSDHRKWDLFLNPFVLPENINEAAWAEIILNNRIYLFAGIIMTLLGGLLNLQKRERFLL